MANSKALKEKYFIFLLFKQKLKLNIRQGKLFHQKLKNIRKNDQSMQKSLKYVWRNMRNGGKKINQINN